jgi:hypothetical protein
MHDTRALVRRHIVRQHDGRLALENRVAGDRAFQMRACRRAQHGVAADAEHLHRWGDQPMRQQVHRAVRLHIGVLQFGMHCQREVRRNRPRRGRPNQDAQVLPCGRVGGGLDDGERHIDRVGDLRCVLHLGVGECGLASGAPERGAQPAIDVAALHQLAEDAHNPRLERIVHREVGVIPLADQPQAFELLALHLHEVLGVVAACAAQGRLVGLLAPREELLAHGVLDGHAVIVPAGHIGRAVAAHAVGAHHDVLERFVERVPDVDVAVGVGRSVVQNKVAVGRGLGKHLAVQVDLAPEGLPARLLFGQVRPHRDGLLVLR